MKTYQIFLLVLLTVMTTGCSNNSQNPDTTKGEEFPEVVADVVIDSEQSCVENSVVEDDQGYDNARTDTYEMISAEINEGCLTLTVRHSGGCENATLTLYDKGSVLESLPAKRLLRLAITDLDDCEMVVQRTEYFDLETIKIPDEDKVSLIIDGLEEEVLFEY